MNWKNYGITVIRFSNEDVLGKIEEVKMKIEQVCEKLLEI